MSIAYHPAFSPIAAGLKKLSAGTTSGRVEIGELGNLVVIYNASDAGIHVRLGDITVEATTTDFLIPAGEWFTLAKNYDQTHIAAEAESGLSKDIYFTPGFAG